MSGLHRLPPCCVTVSKRGGVGAETPAGPVDGRLWCRGHCLSLNSLALAERHWLWVW